MLADGDSGRDHPPRVSSGDASLDAPPPRPWQATTPDVADSPRVSQSAGGGATAPQTPKLMCRIVRPGLPASRHTGGNVGGLPRTRRRSIHASRNLSRALSASLRDRLRRPWTEPVCRQVRQLSGSGEGSGQDTPRSRRLTATVTATAATNGHQQRPATAHNARTIRANLGYVRPEKRKVAVQLACN